MRTTVIFEDRLLKKIRSLVSPRGLSDFINACVREHFERTERAKRQRELENSYARAAKSVRGSDLEILDVEGWPEW